MRIINGDLLEGDWDYACHVANSHCVMGSGIAYFLRKKWPIVFEADLDYDRSGLPKNGNYSVADLPDRRKVFNIYAMDGVGNNGHPLSRNLRYDEFYDALYKVCYQIMEEVHGDIDVKIALPYLVGCARAGGSWNIVHSILQDLEEIFGIEFQIYDFDEGQIKPQSSVVIPK